jgi:hypothetical protein
MGDMASLNALASKYKWHLKIISTLEDNPGLISLLKLTQ